MSFVPESGKGRGCGVVAAAVLALALPATAALADDTGGTLKLNFGNDSFNWLVGQDGQTEFTDDGYVFSGNDYGSGWNMNWEVMSSGSEFIQSITATFSIINTSSSTQLYSLYFYDPVMMETASSLVGGSVGGYVVDINGDGAFISAADSTSSIYRGFVDATEFNPLNGEVVGELLSGSSLEVGNYLTGNFTPESFGNVPTIPGQAGPGIDENIGFGLVFELSAGDAAGFSASFAARVPGPATVGLLGVAGLLGTRRRRR